MCEHFAYESSYISRLLKQFTGKTFKQLVNDERMKQTVRLLHNPSKPIYEIAEEVGFSNPTMFYKRFAEYAGCTPQQYRSKLQKN